MSVKIITRSYYKISQLLQSGGRTVITYFIIVPRHCIIIKWIKLKGMESLSLHKICENTGFHRHVFSRKRTESTILSLYGRIRISENPCSRIFYAVCINTKRAKSYKKKRQALYKKVGRYYKVE